MTGSAGGERRWVEGWDPEFPAGEPSEETEGTVFVTRAGDRSTYWVVAARDADGIRYARTTPNLAAGTVEVGVRRSDSRSTQDDVTYDLTAMTPEGTAELETFAARYLQDIG